MRFVKCKRVLIKPQPAADKIIVFKRYYIPLKRDPSYKRRISFLTQCPENMESMKNLTVVEYIGTFCQKCQPHGNSKRPLMSMSVHHPVWKENQKKRLKWTSELRDLKQVQNTKYYIKKQKTINKLHCQNVADEVQTLLSDMHDHPFIQEVIQTKGKPPSVSEHLPWPILWGSSSCVLIYQDHTWSPSNNHFAKTTCLPICWRYCWSHIYEGFDPLCCTIATISNQSE
mgnify:CR=1 FL=1